MHYTYASPGTAEHYRNTGKFADGTVLVKEVFGTNHGPMTTGDAHWGVRHQGVVRHDHLPHTIKIRRVHGGLGLPKPGEGPRAKAGAR